MRIVVLLSGLLLLASCEWVIVETATLMGTGKTAHDHLISYFSGKDCSSTRIEDGKAYCLDDENNPTRQVHCYKTLGKVSCYEKKDPHGDGQQEVGINDHNYSKRPAR
ncbi:MAG: hypothetical protein ISR52_08660 [Rhodospirillales bacterium]|nr:hypothetical protein [Rhodospirillales bacterium]